MSGRVSKNLDRIFVMICSVAIAIGIVPIAAMLLAALAFANGMIVGIPLVATFDCLREISSSPTVTITGSWIAASIVTVVLALPLWIVALRTAALHPQSTAAHM